MTSFRFTKTQRLLTPAAFRQVFNAPDRKLHQTHLMAFIRKNELPFARIGMAITKRKVPKAVNRNKIKRHIRERFRKSSSRLNGVDVVFIVKKPVEDLSDKDIDIQIDNILKKLVKIN